MENIASGMKSISDDIIKGHEGRKSGISHLKKQAQEIQDNARKFLTEARKSHQEMTKNLKETLQRHREEIIKKANAIREDFRKKEKAIRQDLKEASRIWNEMARTLRSKKIKVASEISPEPATKSNKRKVR